MSRLLVVPKRAIDGSKVLYHYLQKNLREDDIWLFQTMTARLILGLGIWMHPEVYRRFPFLVPHAVRDPDSRGSKKKGIPDQWGSPNERGEFRDDNSLVKNTPKSLAVEAPQGGIYEGGRATKGFVASHVWRVINSGHQLTPRNRLTYSFVPNLVWLPAELSKLTDREGSFVQHFVQALSLLIYRDVEVVEPMVPQVEAAWTLLREPSGIPLEALPEPGSLNFFRPTEQWLGRRRALLQDVVAALETAQTGRTPSKGRLATRYVERLPLVEPGALEKLHRELQVLEDACNAAEEGWADLV